jgi:hypothetical protein
MPNLLRCFFLRLPTVSGNGIPHLVSNSCSCSSSTENHHPHIFEL